MKFRFSPHIAIKVQNYPDAVGFYEKVIGMELIRASGMETELRFGPITFYAEPGDRQAVFFEFVTDDLDAAKRALEEAGCRLEATNTPEGDLSYYVHDPFGLVFHLFQNPDWSNIEVGKGSDAIT